jgi:hypothetical protein
MALPPTSSKLSSDANEVTTFKFDFPNFTGTHTGTLVSLNINSVAGGGTGLASLTANNVILGNGSSAPTFVAPGASGNILTSNGSTWVSSAPSSGTVTSVALADSTGLFNITGSPVTTSGTLTLSSFQSQTQNFFFAAPSGSNGAPTFRAITTADLPSLGGGAFGYTTTATAAGTTVLTSSSTYNQFFTGNQNQTCQLPVTSTLSLGYTFRIYNDSNGSITVNSSGGNGIIIIPGNGGAALLTCILTSGTTAASWTSDAALASTSGGLSKSQAGLLTVNVDGTTLTIGINQLSVKGGGINFSQLNAAVYNTTPTASTLSEWDGHKNLSANSFIQGYTTTATAAGTTTLTVSSTQMQYFTGSTTQTVVLPVATTLVNGEQYQIVNSSSGVVTVQTSGTNTIQAMAANTSLMLTCINTAGGTGTASWSWIYSATQSTSNAGFQYFASSQVTTRSSAVSTTSFSTFNNSPAFTFTPTVTGKYKVYSNCTYLTSAGNHLGNVRVFNTTGGAALLQESQAANYTGNVLDTPVDTVFIQSVYTLTSGISYVFDIQGQIDNVSFSVELAGDQAPFYMFAELCG